MALIKSSESVFSDDFLSLLSQEYDVCLDPTTTTRTTNSSSGTTKKKKKVSTVVTNSRPERVCSSDFSNKIGGELWFLNHTSPDRSESLGTLVDTITSLNTITSIGTVASIGTSESIFFQEIFACRTVTPPAIPNPVPILDHSTTTTTTTTTTKTTTTYKDTCNSSNKKSSNMEILPQQKAVPNNKKMVNIMKSNQPKKKRKRVRRKDPSIKDFVKKTPLDVLMGRGGASNHHEGNVAYRKQILSLQKKYKTLTTRDKTVCSAKVVEWVHKRGGRFLKRQEKGGPWFIVTDDTARQKVSQALREDHTEEGRELKKYKMSLSSKNKNNKG